MTKNSRVVLSPSSDTSLSHLKGLKSHWQRRLQTDKHKHKQNLCTHFAPYTGAFVMFSVITNIYNKKTKGLTLMELLTATGKLKKFFWGDNYSCSMCAPRVTRHTAIRYSSSCHTHVNMGASIFFTAAMIRAFRSARSRGNGTLPTLHEMHIAQ